MLKAVSSESMMKVDMKRWESGRSFVVIFVVGLNGLKQYKLIRSRVIVHHGDITLLHLLFESQNEILTASLLGNEAIVRRVESGLKYITTVGNEDFFRLVDSFTPNDAYVLGLLHIFEYRCQWKLVLHHLGD